MKISIVGATGNVGGRAMEQLVRAGATVTVLVRRPEKLPEPLRRQVRVARGSLEDRSFVVSATEDADALLWMTPTNFSASDLRAYTVALAQNAAQAVRNNGIQRVVFVASHGADRAGFGNVSFAGEVEKILEGAAPNTLSLRSAGHMENLLPSIESLRNGVLFGVLLSEKKYPLVASRDVGDVAAQVLLNSSSRGHFVRGVHGPEDLSSQDQADIIGRVLETPIKYQQIPVEALRETLIKRGATPSVAAGYFEMFSGFAGKDYRPTEMRTAETTTATTLETFVREILAPRIRKTANG